MDRFYVDMSQSGFVVNHVHGSGCSNCVLSTIPSLFHIYGSEWLTYRVPWLYLYLLPVCKDKLLVDISIDWDQITLQLLLSGNVKATFQVSCLLF